MAKTLIDDTTLSPDTLWAWGRVILLGALAGILYWLVAAFLQQAVVEPAVCRNLTDPAACLNAAASAGQLSLIVTTVAVIVAMIKLRVVRPLIVTLASAAVLWNIGGWLDGLFWAEALGYSVLLFAIMYALFGWIARASSLVFAVVLVIVIAITLRIALIV